MKHSPEMIVQLIHIKGPLKGEIQEFSEPEISIGRHPSCHVRFPGGLTLVSRRHARIIREGNRFRMMDRSTNGTFINGKEIKEAHLKEGDVLTIGEGGPQVSFLTRMGALSPPGEDPPAPPANAVWEPPPAREADPGPVVAWGAPDPARPEEMVVEKPAPPVNAPPANAAPAGPAPGPGPGVDAPLVIQFGPTLRSFNELPVVIGRRPDQGFVLEHPAILDRHALIFFSQGQYMVKDLT
ncbi:MAG: FHA domain-containing protein, partial [Desulfobacterales bacterium]|nr:FHA domain-containing protein [Desulfobacterales bacterium]